MSQHIVFIHAIETIPLAKPREVLFSFFRSGHSPSANTERVKRSFLTLDTIVSFSVSAAEALRAQQQIVVLAPINAAISARILG